MRSRDPENRVLKVTLLLTSTLIVMVTGVIAPALPTMEDSFAHVTNVALWVRLVLTIPCLFIAVIAPIAGYVIDKIGRKSVLVISTVLFGVSGVAGYLASTLPLLLLTRASLGIAVGGLMTSVTKLITRSHKPRIKRPIKRSTNAGYARILMHLDRRAAIGDLKTISEVDIMSGPMINYRLGKMTHREYEAEASRRRSQDRPREDETRSAHRFKIGLKRSASGLRRVWCATGRVGLSPAGCQVAG
jgi:hypothetical protein